jgi:predicted MFS family arabinose efflux permease
MVGDRWSVSERWGLTAAAFYGGVIGPPLQVAQNAIAGDGQETALSQNPEYLVLGLMIGAAVFMLVAHVRNCVVLKKGG